MDKAANIGSFAIDSVINGVVASTKEIAQKRRLFLKDKCVALSISESDDLFQNGFALCHLQDALIETSRYILAVGGDLSYGGDLRRQGFTDILIDLVEVYKSHNKKKRLTNYLAWPANLHLTPQREAEHFGRVAFVKIFPEITSFKTETSPAEIEESLRKIFVANSLTVMREKMEKDSFARVFIGGRTKQYSGLIPGVLQEFYFAVKAKKPIYLVGAFGGMTQKIVEILTKKTTFVGTDFGFDTQFFGHYNEISKKNFSEDEVQETLSALSLDLVAASSGLTLKEYILLTQSSNLSIIVYLILKGLSRIVNNNT